MSNGYKYRVNTRANTKTNTKTNNETNTKTNDKADTNTQTNTRTNTRINTRVTRNRARYVLLSLFMIELMSWLFIAGPNSPTISSSQVAQIGVGGRGSTKGECFLSSVEIFPTNTTCNGVIPDLPEPR